MQGDWLFGAAAASILVAATAVWASKVNVIVTEPYLSVYKDEFFHVRQAQAYCGGRFSQWDPKITTPPGLYLISVALRRVALLSDCSLNQLRFVNCLLSPTLLLVGTGLKHAIDGSGDRSQYYDLKQVRSTIRSVHIAINICLFPLLFFFTALYYTDVISTVSVLVNFSFQQKQSLHQTPVLRSVLLLLTGLLALSFRQTNIFWVAVFPAILDVVEVARRNARYTYETRGENAKSFRLLAEDSHIIEASWNRTTLFDVPINDLLLECSTVSLARGIEFTAPTAIVKIPLSIVVGALANLADVIVVLVSYMTLVATFAAFIVWNGGVVLGDKSNHIATLHVPQMLYIWPLIAFFSFPLLYPHVLASLVPCRLLPAFLHIYRPKYPAPGDGEIFNLSRRAQILIWRIVAAPVVLAAVLLIIRHNTIVHPFTLADNRHYVFYVFRLLLRNPSTKYLVAPVYIFCAWAVIQGLCKPCAPRLKSSTNAYWEDSAYSRPAADTCMTSYMLAWLATTTLTLVTAPLVEPRYFILPWIFWRLRVPGPILEGLDETAEGVMTPRNAEPEEAPSLDPSRAYVDPTTKTSNNEQKKREEAIKGPKTKERQTFKDKDVGLASMLNHGDHRLWLETAWFLIINAATGYIFLYKGFCWPQEPGKIQRFMW